MFNRTDTTCLQIKMGMVAYLGGDHHVSNKTDTTCQQVNLGMEAYLGGLYYNQNRDDYEVELCGRGTCGSEVRLHGRVS